MVIRCEKSVAHSRVCAITQLKGVLLFDESLLSCLVQELSSYVVPGLRYEGMQLATSCIR